MSETDGVLTSEHSDYDGSDDEPFHHPLMMILIQPSWTTHQSLFCPKTASEATSQKLIKVQAIITILSQTYGITIKPRTLSRKRNEWGLRRCDLGQATIPAPLTPEVRGSILSSHSKGMNLKEIHARLYKETGVEVHARTVQRYLKKLNLKLLPDDLSEGRVTMDQVYDAINDIRKNLLQSNTGYRRMRTVLMRQHNICIPQVVVYDALKQVDPEGMGERVHQSCKRRVYRTLGPNHIWSCDGHDKLKPFGLTVYGFIDAWSRKILGMYVHVTNNDPRHIAVYFLHIVSKAGGIPFKVTSDHGTETITMAAHQMCLSYQYTDITLEEAEDRMHFTKSTHNQKIEQLWSQMMKQHNQTIKNDIVEEMNSGGYDAEDGVQKLLFKFLWIPVLQSSVDIWYTGVLPHNNQLVKVPSHHIDGLMQESYPDVQEMFAHTPPDFHEVASTIMAELGYEFCNIDPGVLIRLNSKSILLSTARDRDLSTSTYSSPIDQTDFDSSTSTYSSPIDQTDCDSSTSTFTRIAFISLSIVSVSDLSTSLYLFFYCIEQFVDIFVILDRKGLILLTVLSIIGDRKIRDIFVILSIALIALAAILSIVTDRLHVHPSSYPIDHNGSED
ncbi:hypothetical protein PSHT_05944 [Puccinia striiformis]|uniref:Integrase core domain-containing protein n=1 Tax=Puccinia striiformis TaxID=27350 RepID=A0A2S4W953_9BASI|nr:hypothetical protein PSHT_05944 [Puccinia striiformis]